MLYEKPDMEIVLLGGEDIICTSDGELNGKNTETWVPDVGVGDL